MHWQWRRTSGPLRVVTVYATFAALWILLSDYAMVWIFREPERIRLAGTVKGWFFVAVTSCMLYGLMQRQVLRASPMEGEDTLPAHPAVWRSLYYLFAVTTSIGALAVRESIAVSFGQRPLLVVFVFPILLSAFLGGLGPGLVATAVTALGVDILAIPPLGSLWIAQPVDLFQWLFLVASGVLVSLLSEQMHRSRHRAEANRELHAVTLESIGDAVITTDREGRVTFLNPVAERLTGWPGTEVLGRPLREVFRVIREDTREVAEDPVGRVLASGSVVALANHTLLVAKDGREIPILDSAAPIRVRTGGILGVVLAFRDDSERRALLAAQEEKLRALRLLDAITSASSDAIYAKDLEGRYLLLNQEVARIIGKPVHELLGRDDYVFFPPLDAALMQEDDRRVVDENRPMSIERIHVTTRGTRVFVSTKQPLRDEEGKVIGIFGISRDITEQKQAENALRESEESLRRAQSIAHIGSWRLDLASGAMDWSAESYRILGLPLDAQPSFEALIQAIHPDDRESLRASWRNALGGAPFHVEVRIQAGGLTRWVQAQAELRSSEAGRPVLAFGTLQDITERKDEEAERERLQAEFLQSQKMESIGRLAGGVAHDFNNMLQVIAGNTDLALSHADPASPIHAELQLIRKAAERSAALTRQLLAFARRQAIAPKVLDLNDAVSTMLKMLGRLVSEDTRLVWTPGPVLWKTRIDPAQLDQVLANLTVNARDAIEGVGTISLQTANETLREADCAGILGAVPGEYVSLRVQDTGSGIEPEILEHIFEPFFTTKESGKGTGLGLATVFGIARQNGGFVRVESTVGRGSVFTVFLPRLVEEGPQEVQESLPVLRRGRGERILMVEDEEDLLLVGESMLRSLGYEPLACGTPEQAIGRAQDPACAIELFLLDVVMPRMNGRELAERLGELRPGVPVLFMSGYTADVLAARGPASEELHLLAKPFSLRELSVKLRERLEG